MVSHLSVLYSENEVSVYANEEETLNKNPQPIYSLLTFTRKIQK